MRLFHSVWILGTVLFLLLVVSSRLLHINSDNGTHHEEAEKKALVKDPVLTHVASSGDQSGKKVDDGYVGVAATEEVTSGSSSSSSNFEIWDARVGCKEYRKKHQGELGLGFSHNDTVNPSLQQPDAVECGKLKQQHVSILVKKWTWIPETLNNMYSCGCGLTCLWTNTEVLADHPDAHFFETYKPPLKRVRGEPLRAFLELEASPHRSGSEDLFVSYHASSSVQVTYAGASFHVVRNYYVSPVKQTEALVYWSSSRCVDERQKIASSFLSLLPHHSFGKCLNNVGGQDKIFDMYPKCKDGIGAGNAWSQSLHCAMSHYKFALAIENTRTESYITEKLYYPLDVGTVPIYFGAPNVLDFVPPHSIIDGSKFQTLQELADYVRKVGADPVLYAEYHAWRRCGVMGHYGHTRAVSLDSLPCRLCAAVSQLGGKDAPASG